MLKFHAVSCILYLLKYSNILLFIQKVFDDADDSDDMLTHNNSNHISFDNVKLLGDNNIKEGFE